MFFLPTYWIICSSTWPSRVEFNEFLCWKYVCRWKEWLWVQFSIGRTCANLKSESVHLCKLVQTNLHTLNICCYSKTPPPAIQQHRLNKYLKSHFCVLYIHQWAIWFCIYLYISLQNLCIDYMHVSERNNKNKMLLTSHSWELHVDWNKVNSAKDHILVILGSPNPGNKNIHCLNWKVFIRILDLKQGREIFLVQTSHLAEEETVIGSGIFF